MIGDGGAKKELEEEISRLGVENIQLLPPVKRDKLIDIYKPFW